VATMKITDCLRRRSFSWSTWNSKFKVAQYIHYLMSSEMLTTVVSGVPAYLSEHSSGEHSALHAEIGVLSVQTELLDLVEQDHRPLESLQPIKHVAHARCHVLQAVG
jgi:hypothetical protein